MCIMPALILLTSMHRLRHNGVKYVLKKQAGSKGQIISKHFFLVEDSSKKRTNEFVFTSMQLVFVRFLEESSARKKRFEII